MKPEWILVSSAARARLFRRGPGDARLVALQTFEASDHGPEPTLASTAATAVGTATWRVTVPRPSRIVSPQRKRQLEFARTLAQRLETGLASGACDSITLFAACPFIGVLRAQLSPAAKSALRASVDVDLTGCDLDELEQRIDEELEAFEAQRP